MSRRHKKKREYEELKLNVTAMLDMAFQLLAFFVLTFRPAPIEGQVQLRLPPAQAVTVQKDAQSAGADKNNTNPLQGLNSLAITVLTDSGKNTGMIDKIVVLDSVSSDVRSAEAKIQAKLSEPGSPLDQVVIQVDPKLKYEELMKIVDICSRAKLANGERLSKLSFAELPAGN